VRIISRQKAIYFFLSFGVCLAALAGAVGSGWVILNWREGVKVFLGVIFFGAIVTGLVLNTIFLVREIRRNEQHDSFINAVTHELKTPITSIRLYLETLQRRELDEEQRQKFYGLMLLDTGRLLGTVEQVLAAGQSGHKSARKYRTEIDFAHLVRECMDLARSRHHLESTGLRFEPLANGAVDGNELKIQGDPEELRTAVSNLLDNAIKYSVGNVDVSVSVEASDEKHVALKVRDRGVGIPSDELKRIFRRFYRVRGRASARVKGTGLGLYIVRSIAKTHGGKVFAESAGEGRGTTVTLELPRSRA
jgi:two-component system, OmpR family, sensor histidine kinase SenX3